MTTIALYNVYVGRSMPRTGFDKVELGPITVRLLADYSKLAQGLHFPERRLEDVRGVTFTDRRDGNWTHTADAEVLDPKGESLILSNPSADGGIWDVCQLLTFITGRIVAKKEDLYRHRHDLLTDDLCVEAETLLALKVAWGNRQKLIDETLLWAFLNYTEAIRTDNLQTKGLHLNAALNVLIDKYVDGKSTIPKVERERAKKEIEAFLQSLDYLSEEQRADLIPRISARLNEGPSMFTKLVSLLQALDIVPPGSNSEPMLARVRFLNSVRNAFAHRGNIPIYPDLTAEESLDYAANVVGGVVPAIVAMALAKVLGFAPQGVGSKCMDTAELRRFFSDGVWHDYTVGSDEFDAWFRDPQRTDFAFGP